MKIAYFVWEYTRRLVGGLGTYSEEITKQYARMGHEIVVFTMNDGDKLPKKETINGVEVHRPVITEMTKVLPLFANEELKAWGPGLGFFSDILMHNLVCANKFVNEVSKKEKFDLVVCHDWLSSIAGVMAKEKTGLPLVLHMHSTEFGRRGDKASSTVKEIEHFTGNYADLVITVSEFMKKELVSLGFPGERVVVVLNGVDVGKYDMRRFGGGQRQEFRKKNGISADEKMILFTGRLTEVKGADTLIRAMPLVLKKVPKAKLVLLGKGEMEEELKGLVKQFSMGDRVLFINRWVEEEERIMLYASSDVVCAPSRYEPFGIVPLEAMSLGKPVVVGLGGLRETVQDGVNGFHCDPNSPESVADELVRILENEELAKKFGESGRKRAEEKYMWGSIADKTMGIYMETAEKKSRGVES